MNELGEDMSGKAERIARPPPSEGQDLEESVGRLLN